MSSRTDEQSEHLSSLHGLNLKGNKLGLKDSQALKNALRHNENLQQLQIRV